jgi:electron transport complex protein RnfA
VNNHAAGLALLGIFSSFSMNLILQCGLGLRQSAVSPGSDKKLPFIKVGIVFVTTLFLWVLFTSVLFHFNLGFFKYLLVFPLSSLIYFCLEGLLYRGVLKKEVEADGATGFCDGLAGAALFITLNIASGFVEAAVLCFGFSFGMLLVLLILDEIRRRSMMEATPRFLRGSPLMLVSMGFLSLVFSSAAFMLLRALGG